MNVSSSSSSESEELNDMSGSQAISNLRNLRDSLASTTRNARSSSSSLSSTAGPPQKQMKKKHKITGARSTISSNSGQMNQILPTFAYIDGLIEDEPEAKLSKEREIWDTAYDFLKKKCPKNIYIDKFFWGNYFGNRTAKYIQANNHTGIKVSYGNMLKIISKQLNAMTCKNEEKLVIFLIMSTITVPGVEGLVTHSAMLVVQYRNSKREYYYYETMADVPHQTYAPMNYIADMPKLWLSDVLNIVNGNQTTSADCFARCIAWISDLLEGNVKLEKGNPYPIGKVSRGVAGLMYECIESDVSL